MTRVSIVIPAKDEEANLASVLEEIHEVLPKLGGHEVEVICVDHHSPARPPQVPRAYGARVVSNPRRPGKGMALRAGFEQARGDILVMMDADCSHRAEELPRFLEALRDGVGLVIGSRVVGGSEEYTHIRALGNVFLSATLGLCTGRYLSDALNGYKAFRRDVFTDFRYTSKAFEIEIELIANALRKGYRVVEISSSERARAGGVAKSKVIRHGTRFLLRMLWEGFRGVRPAPSAVPRTTSGHRAPRQASFLFAEADGQAPRDESGRS